MPSSSWFLANSLAVTSLAHHKYAQFRQEAMKCLHRIPWKRLVVPRLVLNNGVVIPRGEKKKKKRLRAGFPTMNRRESGDEVVGVAGALAEVLLSKSVALPARFPGAEVGIAPLQWNMQAFYMLIKPPPRSADLSG